MKHGQLRSVAHSMADSLASGVSLMTGIYDLHVYEDALRSENGVLTVDLLNGKVIKGEPSANLAAAILCLPREFDRLCRADGFSRSDCRNAVAHFHANKFSRGFTLFVEDKSGQATETDFQGVPARRVIETDRFGRLRRRPIRRLA